MTRLKSLLLTWLFLAATMATGSAHAGKAVDFELVDVTGKVLHLSDFKGRWLLVNFWAPWCPMCASEVPTLNSLNKRDDFAVIGISLDYGSETSAVKDFAEKHGFAVAAIVPGGARRDQNSPFRQVGPVDFFPTSYLYAPDGEIVMFIPGLVKEEKLRAFMKNWEKKAAKK
jgi:thiol-disulfide isomerase/thioredoxin